MRMPFTAILRARRHPSRPLATVAAGVALALIAPLALPGAAARSRSDSSEVRALWVTRATLGTPASISAMVRVAAGAGFNTLLVQVRGRGDAFFNRRLEPRAAALAGQPAAFDPLQAVIDEAHAAGLRVHAWFNVNLVASASDVPLGRGHVALEHPEWLMVPRALAHDLAAMPARDSRYRAAIARWTRGQRESVEGLYLSPIPAPAARYTARVATELVRRYAIDGLHLDYVRYPSAEFDYSRLALEEFRARVVPDLDPDARRDLDRRARRDPLVYAAAFPERWRAFRRERLTALVAVIRTGAHAARPSVLLTAAVVPNASEARADRLQDWPAWLHAGLLDVACPMAYAVDGPGFLVQMAGARDAAGDAAVWAGIGAYRLGSAQAVEHIKAARHLGAAGIVLFSYDSLATADGGAGEYLAHVAHAAFNQ